MLDKDKFKQAFLEEAREILVELESSLLALNDNRGDNELVGRAFRALHTIKGSGAMFGFDELAAFSHNLENAFDEVRNGRLQVTSELINLSLAALDQIKAMLDEAAGGAGASVAASAEILAKLRRLTGKPETHAAAAAPSPQAGVLLDHARDSLAAGEFDDAERDAKRVLDVGTPRQKSVAHFILGKVLRLESHKKDAAEEFAKAVELDSENSAAIDQLASIRHAGTP